MRLISIARDVANKQINLLKKPDNEPTQMSLCLDEADGCQKMQTFVLKGKARSYPFSVRILGVTSSGLLVRVCSGDASFNFQTIEFEVSYFDTPFMNNTKLIDGSRFSFVLRKMDPQRKIATMEVVVFPEEYMNLRDRPYFDEMLSRLGGGAKKK